MKRFFKIFIWVIVAVVFIGTFVFLYKNSQPKEVSYQLVSPEIGSIERTTVLTGKIEPRDQIDIKPQISGIISEILVEAGQTVREGDIIARIKVIPDASQLSSAQNRVEQAKIALADATDKYERSKTLYERKLISREEYETAQATYDRSKSDLTGAEDALDIVRNGVSRYNASESNTMVRATIDGLVLDVPVKVGSSVIQANTFNDGTTVATIADMTNLIFKGNVDETEVGQLSVGMPMTISVGAMPDIAPHAVIEYISPKGNESSGANTFELKAAIDVDPDVQLRAGYSANASVILNSANDVLTIPESVVEFVGDSTFVYCMTDSVPQKFERTAVKTGLGDGVKVEVKDGIASNARLRGAEIKK